MASLTASPGRMGGIRHSFSLLGPGKRTAMHLQTGRTLTIVFGRACFGPSRKTSEPKTLTYGPVRAGRSCVRDIPFEPGSRKAGLPET